MASAYYTDYKDRVSEIDLLNDDIKVALFTVGHVFSAANSFFSDLSNEIVGTGYVAGGKSLTGKTIVAGVFDANDVSWNPSTLTARYAIMYKDTGDPATSRLIRFYDPGAAKSSSSNSFVLQLDALGVLTFTYV